MSTKLRSLRKIKKKKLKSDALYKSTWFRKFCNKLGRHGKRNLIEKILSKIFCNLKRKYNRSGSSLLLLILLKIRPRLGTIKKRVGKIWKEIPVPLSPRNQLVLALRWIVIAVRMHSAKTIYLRTVNVFKDCWKVRTKSLFMQKTKHYRTLIAERINARYRWK